MQRPITPMRKDDAGKLKEVKALIDISFLPPEMKDEYQRMIEENAGKIGLI